jgi:hypothetical protein
MLPLLKTKLEAGAIAGALVIGGIALHEHDAKVREQAVAAAVVATQKQVQADADKKISDLAKQMDARDLAYKQQLETLNSKFQTAATPQQLAVLVSSLMGLKTPIQITTPPATPQNPNPQPVAVLQGSDFPAAKSYFQACEQCSLDKAKLTADAADRQAQANLAQLQIESLRKENTALLVEAHGGTLWQRTKRALVYIGIGAAGGAAALGATGHIH